jgi:hypothetical protein
VPRQHHAPGCRVRASETGALGSGDALVSDLSWSIRGYLETIAVFSSCRTRIPSPIEPLTRAVGEGIRLVHRKMRAFFSDSL